MVEVHPHDPALLFAAVEVPIAGAYAAWVQALITAHGLGQ
jgi:hypothetical protein